MEIVGHYITVWRGADGAPIAAVFTSEGDYRRAIAAAWDLRTANELLKDLEERELFEQYRPLCSHRLEEHELMPRAIEIEGLAAEIITGEHAHHLAFRFVNEQRSKGR